MAINFKVVYLPENQGHGNARRKSLEECTNELVALMDSDDISFSNRFEKQLSIFTDTENVDIVGGQITEFIGEPENITGKRVVPESDTDIKKFMKKRCPMNQVSVMFKKTFYDKVGGYIDWFCEEDYYLWLRMAEAGGVFANVPETLVNVRIGNAMSARRGGLKYFFSEARIQKYMYSKRIISLPRFVYNVALRFGGEVLLPNGVRTYLFKKLRDSVKNEKLDLKKGEERNHREEYPPFSVAMCVYGGDNPEWFDRALESIVFQTVQPEEIVLVVDGPIPQPVQEVIDRYINLCRGDIL
ncbi:MAG: glycosyltransferase [Monoglobales bacterium]